MRYDKRDDETWPQYENRVVSEKTGKTERAEIEALAEKLFAENCHREFEDHRGYRAYDVDTAFTDAEAFIKHRNEWRASREG